MKMKETLQPKLQRQLGLGLLAMRLSIALVFIMWALDKVLVPEHAMKVFSGFYGLDISSGFSVALGIAQLVFIGIFVAGLWKNLTYLAILVLHAGSTFSSFAKYLDPFNNLLFFAAWPMLAACFALYLLRDHDIYVLRKQPQTVTA
ncbi:membrane protein [Vibrio owensii CAIM 1854 = LMG 25443]|uniref:Membrane protein n=2 Tax=Vibrio owensii TaxID=696485 RepID=A0A0C1ZL15_9VIBR|nr:membrane protein [Vibrio owensii CAIM 1854 = LMG 25443]